MTIATIGVGSIGSVLARHLVGRGEPLVLAAKDMPGSDLHQFGMNGRLVDLDKARGAVAPEVRV